MRHAVASERRGHPRPRGGGRVRRRQVPRQRDAGNGGRGRSERSERSPLRDKLLPLRSSAHKKKRGCLKSRRTDSHLLFLYYVRMVLPSAELRSASPTFSGFAQVLRGCRADALHPHDFTLRYSGRQSLPFFYYSETGRMDRPSDRQSASQSK